MESGIYKITNKITGKCYVGSTKNFSKRWQRHFRDLKEGKHHSIKLQRSYNKYGEDAFVCEVIEEVPYTKDVILEREQFWISKFDAYEHGYNIGEASFGDTLTHNPNREKIIESRRKTWHNNHDQMTSDERKEKWGQPGKLNGMYGKHRTDEEKQHLRETNKGRPSPNKGKRLSDKTKNKISKVRKEKGVAKGEKNPFYGRHHSNETKNKLSELHKGKKPANRRKVITDGILFDSVHDCAKYHKVCLGTVIFRIKSIYWNWRYVG